MCIRDSAQVTGTDILDVAREQVLERGVPLTQEQIEQVLRLSLIHISEPTRPY